MKSSEINDLLSKLHRKTNEFVDKTKICENQLSSIEDKMAPIQRSTKAMVDKQKKFEHKRLELEKINSYLTAATTVKPLLGSDNKSDDYSNLSSTFEALERLSEAKLFLNIYRKKIATASIEYESVERLLQVPYSI